MSQTKAQLIEGTSDALFIDSSDRVLLGKDSWSGGYTRQVIEANSTSSTGPGVLYLARGAESPTAGQDLGEINFSNTTGDQGAQIIGSSDGTWATDDYPGRLEFHTTADGASSPTEAMRIDSSQNLRFNSGYGSVTTAFGVRAWINFDGSASTIGTGRGSGNMDAVTDNGSGDYTVNFTNDMPDVNYAVAGLCYETGSTGATDNFIGVKRATNYSDSIKVGSVRVATNGGGDRDVFVMIVR